MEDDYLSIDEDDYLSIDEDDTEGRKWMVRESVLFKTLYIFLQEKKMWGEFYRDHEKSNKGNEDYQWIWGLEGAKIFERKLSQMHFDLLLDYGRHRKYTGLSDDFGKLLVKLNIGQD